LGVETASPLEKLLIQRVVLCWLACHAAEVERAERLQSGTSELLKAADKRVDRAHTRFLSATKALASVRKLLAPSVPKVALLTVPSILPVPADHGPIGTWQTPVLAG
jgi:hypothetical protein